MGIPIMVTYEEYECALNLVQNYNKNPDAKACMDEAEQESFQKALDIINEYKKQRNPVKNVAENIKQKSK